jgi:hypothetical protein
MTGEVLATALIVVAVAGVVVLLLPPVVRWSAARLPARVGIELVPSVRPIVERRVRRDHTGAAIGFLAGLAFGFSVPAGDGSFALLFPAGLWAGFALGTAVAAATGRPRPDADAPRVARVRPPTIEDYVPPRSLVVARVVGSIAAVASASLLLATLARDPSASATPALATALAVAALLVLEIGGRRIAAAPSRATDAAELAWDDAMRGQALQQLAWTPLVCSIYVVGAALGELEAVVGPSSGDAISIAGVALLMAVGGVALAQRRLEDSGRHYLRRLWPHAAGGGAIEYDARERTDP